MGLSYADSLGIWETMGLCVLQPVLIQTELTQIHLRENTQIYIAAQFIAYPRTSVVVSGVRLASFMGLTDQLQSTRY